MFDFNPKPNLTGAARPHRMNQNCLTMISAAAQGWSYFACCTKCRKGAGSYNYYM